jgi:metal transporter CNNM
MARTPMRQTGRFHSYRPAILSSVKLLFLSLSQLPGIKAVPIYFSSLEARSKGKDEGMPADSPTLWIYLVIAIGLVLLGGAFAGLTIALMGQVLDTSNWYRALLIQCRMKYISK